MLLDNNLNTRWSNNGKGSWIQLDLGTSKNICSVNIAWYKGNERQNNFVISTSKDGSTFTKVLKIRVVALQQTLKNMLFLILTHDM